MMRPHSTREVGLVLSLATVLLLAACSSAAAGLDRDQAVSNTPVPTATDTVAATTPELGEGPAPAVPASIPAPAAEKGILTEDDRPARLQSVTADWNTNWNRHTIEYDELLSGGPPRDGIP
ncbi:MAG: hypothetical protein GQ526_07920, partial [Ardenticatenales bacterium]|nr:hypothetical protein [Ardenticatenales bacterium]